jgi:nicotinate-nucleotide adenylyltransferase
MIAISFHQEPPLYGPGGFSNRRVRMAKTKKIGILGGTFDPIHLGHLVLAEQVREKLKLDQVIFIPCLRSPHKTRQKLSPAKDRFQMIRLAVEGNPSFCVSDIELKRRGVSYTVDTLRRLKDVYSESQIYFLTGSDVLNELGTWKDPERIYRLAKVVIATRPGFDEFDRRNRFAKKSIVVPITGIDVSSSEIRRRVKKGKSIEYLVPSVVEDYIEEKRLYRR